MCNCDDICFYYGMLKKHNKILAELLHKYIEILENYICLLQQLSRFGQTVPDKMNEVIVIPDELFYLVKNLIPKKCNHHNCADSCADGCADGCSDDYDVDPRGKAFYIICIDPYVGKTDMCTDRNNRKCDRSDCGKTLSYRLKNISMACMAKYFNKQCVQEYLCPCDILFNVDDNFSIDNKINQYIGFKLFFRELLELLAI
jgi:hypothetical protein